MKLKKYVIDASVVIKWLTGEKEDLEEALRIREELDEDKIEVFLPAFILWELGNFLGRTRSKEGAMEHLSHFKMLCLPLHQLNLEVASIAFELMKKCPGASFYDASYHALAFQKEAVFITSDKKYYNKAERLGNIMLLKDYPSGKSSSK